FGRKSGRGAQSPQGYATGQASAGLDAGAAAGVAAGLAGLAVSVDDPPESLFDSPLESALGSFDPPSPPSARLRLRSPSFLKSVSYQPPPARRNDGAVNVRFTEAALQDGQASGSGSESFCRRSKLWPHCSQRYA